MPELKIVDSLLTPQQAADYLQVKLSTIYQWSMRRTLPVCKLGRLNRFRKSDLDAFINQNITEVQQ
ncbi:MAG TPA: helix-turn-helix domain-containing protein [Candidatus Wunengus sp. YC60]|uniref:helix-turn-helix domain-containing protein n=1 Tax=Candidatus Wunengus sp. YC60 TaxID=3367697 RepID=UPI0040283887